MERAGHHDAAGKMERPTQATITEQHAGLETGVPAARRSTKWWPWALVAAVALLGVVFLVVRKAEPERVADATHATNKTNAPVAQPKLDLTTAQTEAAQRFVAAAADVSESLAADDLAAFNRAAAAVAPALEKLAQSLPPDHPWLPLLGSISHGGKLIPAGDLAEARKEFIPFSAATTDFIKLARQQNAALGSLKIYRCPMAPQPGFWVQLHGPIRNPYFGSEMLDCGSEINP
jgi:hypothetical protein